MDIATVIGFIVGAVALVLGVLSSEGNAAMYINIPSLLVTVVGSFACIIIGFSMQDVLNIPKYFGLAFKAANHPIEKIIQTLIAFSEKARRDGLLALEDELEAVDDNFMRKGLQLVVDGTDPEIIENILITELNRQQDRHKVAISIFSQWASLAPGFGMIGTLLGLIAMLVNIEDKASIGPMMGLALITTLYGSILSNLFLIPIKTKLELRDSNEAMVKELIIEGILSIQSGDNPRILEEKLLCFLAPNGRQAIQQMTQKD